MSETIIIGKCGSGKTFFAVKKIVEQLADWCRYEKKQGEPFSRRIVTNVILNAEEIDALLSKRLGWEVHVEKYIIQLDDETLIGQAKAGFRWWEEFPMGAYVVIDELHKFLGEGLAYDFRDYRDAYRDWAMEHRQRQQDHIYITQSQDNIDRAVLRAADERFELRNVKSLTIPGLGVPLKDLETLKEAFGINYQYAVAIRGVYHSNKLVFDGDKEHVLIEPSICACYRSHRYTEEASDRPSLKLGRVGALVWFSRRHFWHLGLKCLIIYVVFTLGWSFVWSLPDAAANGFLKTDPKKAEAATPAPPSVGPVAVDPLGFVAVNTGTQIGDDKITGIVPNGVITSRGIIRVDGHLTYEGETDYVKSVDISTGTILLGSGKTYKK